MPVKLAAIKCTTRAKYVPKVKRKKLPIAIQKAKQISSVPVTHAKRGPTRAVHGLTYT